MTVLRKKPSWQADLPQRFSFETVMVGGLYHDGFFENQINIFSGKFPNPYLIQAILKQSKSQPQSTITKNVGDGFWTENSQINNQ